MDTTIIIILVSLIIVIGIAIVTILLKGKKEEDKPTEDSTKKTFQENTPEQKTPQEPQIYTPNIQTEEPPVMQDLSTPQPPAPVAPTLDQPINEPPIQTQQVPIQPVSNTTQDKDLYNQKGQSPSSSQVTQDMENLNQTPPVQTVPIPDTTQHNIPPSQEKEGDDVQTIIDALNTPQPTPNTPIDNNIPNVNQPPVIEPMNPVPPVQGVSTPPPPSPI